MICTVIWPSIAWTPRPCSSGISASGLLTPLQPRESSERIVAAIQYWHFRTLQCKILDIIGSCSYMLIHLKKFSSWLKFSLASIFLATAAAVRSFPFSFDFSSSAWYRSSSSACWESMTAFSSTRCFHCSSSWKNCNRHSAFKLTPTENYESRVGFMSKKKHALSLLKWQPQILACFCFTRLVAVFSASAFQVSTASWHWMISCARFKGYTVTLTPGVAAFWAWPMTANFMVKLPLSCCCLSQDLTSQQVHAHVHTFPSEHAARGYFNYPCHDVSFSSNLTTHPPFSDPSMRCLHLFGDDLCLLFSFHLPALQLRCMRCEGQITRFLRQAKAVVSTWLCYRTTFVQ